MWLIVLLLSPFIVWADIKLFKFFYSTIFSDEEDFNDSIKYSFTPDIFSLFKGEYIKDNFAEFKLGLFMFLCIGTVVLEIFLAKAII